MNKERKMKKRYGIMIAFLLAASGLMAACSAAPPDPNRPAVNIVLPEDNAVIVDWGGGMASVSVEMG